MTDPKLRERTEKILEMYTDKAISNENLLSSIERAIDEYGRERWNAAIEEAAKIVLDNTPSVYSTDCTYLIKSIRALKIKADESEK